MKKPNLTTATYLITRTIKEEDGNPFELLGILEHICVEIKEQITTNMDIKRIAVVEELREADHEQD